jgi:hypothetical protein
MNKVLENLSFQQSWRTCVWHSSLDKIATPDLIKLNAELLSNLYHRQNVLKHLKVGSMGFSNTLTEEQQQDVNRQADRISIDRQKLIDEIKQLVDDYHTVESKVVEIFGARLGIPDYKQAL